MRTEPNLLLERHRANWPGMPESPHGVNYGCFRVMRPSGDLRIISSGSTDGNPGGCGWEHVSVSLATRVPNWEELRLVKELFWRDDETVVHFIPRKDAYVNVHPYVMHLWKRGDSEYELPPRELIA